MTEELKNKIYSIIEEYRDPATNRDLDIKRSNINIVNNTGNLTISLDIDPSKYDEYSKINENLYDQLIKLKDIKSVKIILTTENKPNKIDQNNKKFKIYANKIIAIASGKGGVGKSTFAVNLSVSLNKLNMKVGLLDADIYGPSIPRMMGINKKPETNENKKLIPLERHNIKCMSIGFLIDVDTPTIWRGPMVMKALEQMFNGVEWGKLDYLIVDLPPGTGDAQLSLAQNSFLDGSIIISTPQDVALSDARKGINMFKKVNVPVLGVVENMSYFICDKCEARHEIFSSGSLKKEAIKYNTNYLGDLPLDKNIRINSDNGNPICIEDSEGEISKIYLSIAKKINETFD